MGEDTDQAQTVSTRRKMIKLASGTAASAFVLPGIAAANDTSEYKRQEQENGITSQQIRARKAAEMGKEWNEEWIDEDKIGKGLVINKESKITTQRTRYGGVEATIAGIKFSLQGCFGNCDGYIEISGFGQTSRSTYTCSKTCGHTRLDAGVAHLIIDPCINLDTLTYTVDVHGCVYHIIGWSCASETITLSLWNEIIRENPVKPRSELLC